VIAVTYLFIIKIIREKNQKKRNIKSRKIDKEKKNISVQVHYNTLPSSSGFPLSKSSVPDIKYATSMTHRDIVYKLKLKVISFYLPHS